MSTLFNTQTAVIAVMVVVALAVLTGVLGYMRLPGISGKRGAGSNKVLRRSSGADETEALAGVAEREYYARKTPAYRALALRQIRKWSAIAGAVLMAGLGAWSAVGVHEGVAKDAEPGSIDWILGWVLEPVLLSGVALIVIARAMLAMAGARLSPSAWGIELGLLGLSVAANAHALPDNPTLADYVMRLTGPIGCLLVSLVLVLVEKAVQAADIEVSAQTEDRWDGVRTRLADTATSMAERAADSLAVKLSGVSVDAERTVADTPTGQGADTSADTSIVTSRTAADSTTGQPVSVAATSDITAADTTADTNGRTPGHHVDTVTDAPSDTANGQAADNTKDVSAPAKRTVFEDALDKARTLGADTVDSLSVRALAEAIGCGRTTASQVRAAVLEEQAEGNADEADTYARAGESR